jgi:HPt (histidine-containing phosphotransfer) domain-containing protein
MGLLTPMNASAIIDPQAVAGLRDLNPDEPGFLRELIDLFLEDVPARIAEIEQSLANRDAVLLTRAAHTIKGSCSNFGAGELARVSLAMELQGKSAAFAAAADTLPSLRAEYAQVVEALKAYR